ncbi:ribonuclease H-like domain-containing protein [Tanacetum coccineum]
MDTLSLVSKYSNDLEEYLDNGDSLEVKKFTVGKSKEELEMCLGCGTRHGGFVQLHDRREESLRCSLVDFLVTSNSKVNIGADEMRIDLTMLEEEKESSRNKGHNVNKLTPPPQQKIKEIPPISSIAPPPPIYLPLSQKQKETIKEALDRKYKELEDSKPILEVLENYINYRKNLDEVMTGRARLSSDEFGEEEKMRIVEHGLPKKMCDPRNFVLPVRVNGTVEMSALADTRASISVFPYSLFKNLRLSDPRPYNFNLTMADNTQVKVMGEVRNVRIQIGYQAYLVDFLVLDIPKDKEPPLLLGRPFLRTCGSVIDTGRGTISSLPVQLKNTDWGNEGYEVYKKIEGDGAWHAKFEKSTQSSHQNLLIANYEKRNSTGTIEYHLQQKNANLKWRELPSMERHAYCERLSKLQGKEIGTPRVADWNMFYVYGFDETLKELMKFEYIHSNGDVFVDYSWERALSINGDVYPEWCLEFFSMMYFDREFTILLGLYEESELEHRLFATHFTILEIDDKLCNHDAYWQIIGTPTSTNRRTSIIKEPLIRVVHRLIVGSLVHRLGSKKRCQKRDLWMMSALEESRGINLAWVIAHLYKHASGLMKNSLICGGHYVTEIAKSLGYLVPSLPRGTRKQRHEPSGLNSSWGDRNASLNLIEHRDVWRDPMLMRNNYMLKHFVPILHHLAYKANFAYPTYEPPNVPRYPYPSGYEIGGSSGGVHGDDDDDGSDQFVCSKNCMVSEDNDDDDMEGSFNKNKGFFDLSCDVDGQRKIEDSYEYEYVDPLVARAHAEGGLPYRYPPNTLESEPGVVRHALLIVGLNTMSDNRDEHYCLVKNSYGEEWGDKGYSRVGIEVFIELLYPKQDNA